MTPNESYHKYKHTKWYKNYRKKFESTYRNKNRLMWNFKSWKSMQRKAGKKITIKKEFEYLLLRALND